MFEGRDYYHVMCLISGHEKGLIADRQVRVSVKALALGCIGSALLLHPAAFLAKLHISSSQPGRFLNPVEICYGSLIPFLVYNQLRHS